MAVSYQETDSAVVQCSLAAFCSGLGLNAGATRSKIASAGGVAGSVGASSNTDASASHLVAVQFEIAADVGNGAVWGAGNWTIRLNITAANAFVTWEDCYICRVSNACVSQATIGSSLNNAISLSTTGVKSVVISGGLQSPSTGDLVEIVLSFSNSSGSPQGFTFTSDQLIDSPFTPSAAPPMDAGRRWMYYASQVRM